MRALSKFQASRCEHATTPTCRCRCGGTYHGASRAENVSTLSPGDPHRPAEKRPPLKRPQKRPGTVPSGTANLFPPTGYVSA